MSIICLKETKAGQPASCQDKEPISPDVRNKKQTTPTLDAQSGAVPTISAHSINNDESSDGTPSPADPVNNNNPGDLQAKSVHEATAAANNVLDNPEVAAETPAEKASVLAFNCLCILHIFCINRKQLNVLSDRDIQTNVPATTESEASTGNPDVEDTRPIKKRYIISVYR